MNPRKHLLALGCLVGATAAEVVKPHILSVMVDDLGFYNTQVNNPNAPTPTIGKLMSEGIRLERHYSYMYCSPTRRSFLAGRFATRINPDQASPCDNFLPLQFTLFPQKLSTAGYISHFVGKGHLGYPTTDHLPINRGYSTHVGYLGGAEGYNQTENQSHDFWHDDRPANATLLAEVWYSTNYYTTRATNLIAEHDPTVPLYMDLRYQGVHGPYVEPPVWEQVANTSSNMGLCGPEYSCQVMDSMVAVVDTGIANVTQMLTSKGMWNSTLFVLFGDNGGGMGGTEPSNNYPLRGTKGEPWEGAVRVAAFVGGGLIPAARRGLSLPAQISVADWYPTFLSLAGLSPAEIADDVEYGGATRSLDGVNAWPMLMGEVETLGREWLPTTNQSLIWNSTWKLITTAPSTHWFTPNDSHIEDGWPCRARSPRNVSTKGEWMCEVCSDAEPCLFNLIDDPEERKDLAAQNPEIVNKMRQAMFGLNFPPYTGSALLPDEAAKYECLEATTARAQFWGGMAGPCCHPKGPGPWPPPSPPAPPTPPAPPHKLPGLHSNLDQCPNFTHDPTGALELQFHGWAWNGSWPKGGVAAVPIEVVVDGQVITTLLANVSRPDLPSRSGAPNPQHGFAYVLRGSSATTLAGSGRHALDVRAADLPGPGARTWTALRGSPCAYQDGKPVPHQ